MTSPAPDVLPSILTDYTYDSELDVADGVPLKRPDAARGSRRGTPSLKWSLYLKDTGIMCQQCQGLTFRPVCSDQITDALHCFFTYFTPHSKKYKHKKSVIMLSSFPMCNYIQCNFLSFVNMVSTPLATFSLIPLKFKLWLFITIHKLWRASTFLDPGWLTNCCNISSFFDQVWAKTTEKTQWSVRARLCALVCALCEIE